MRWQWYWAELDWTGPDIVAIWTNVDTKQWRVSLVQNLDKKVNWTSLWYFKSQIDIKPEAIAIGCCGNIPTFVYVIPMPLAFPAMKFRLLIEGPGMRKIKINLVIAFCVASALFAYCDFRLLRIQARSFFWAIFIRDNWRITHPWRIKKGKEQRLVLWCRGKDKYSKTNVVSTV